MKIPMKLFYQYMAIFFNFSPTSSHLYSLQVENCDSNSRLVVDEDDNGKFRLERINTDSYSKYSSRFHGTRVFRCFDTAGCVIKWWSLSQSLPQSQLIKADRSCRVPSTHVFPSFSFPFRCELVPQLPRPVTVEENDLIL